MKHDITLHVMYIEIYDDYVKLAFKNHYDNLFSHLIRNVLPCVQIPSI